MGVPVSLNPTLLQWGVNGQAIAGMDTGYAANVQPLNPTLIILEWGPNDAAGGTSQASFLASGRSFLNKALAQNAAMKFIFINEGPCDGEVWQAGPVWGGNAFDAAFVSRNTDIVTMAAQVTGGTLTNSPAGGNLCPIYDVRADMLKMEVVRNPAKASGGRCTLDQVHPTPEVELMMSRGVYGLMTPTSGIPQDIIVVVGTSITNPAGPNGGWHLEPTGLVDMLKSRIIAHSL